MKFQLPCSILLCGPSFSGKSFMVAQLIKERMFEPWPDVILWVYTEDQPLFDTVSGVEFIEGFSADDIEEKIGDRTAMLIIDDCMAQAACDPKLTAFFTKKVHHRGISVCFIIQRLFPPEKEFRTMSLNASYLILTKNCRDKSQIATLGSQVAPGSRFLQESYRDATRDPFGYIVLDFKQETPESLRVRTNVLPNEGPVIVYVQK